MTPTMTDKVIEVTFWRWVSMRQYSHYEIVRKETMTPKELNEWLTSHEDQLVQATPGNHEYQDQDGNHYKITFPIS